jgi:hypothetical protein
MQDDGVKGLANSNCFEDTPGVSLFFRGLLNSGVLGAGSL